MRVRRLASACVALLGCGRVGFDDRARPAIDAADALVDAAPDAPSLDYCTTVPALAAAPVIDGVLDPGLATTPITPVGWTSAGSVPSDNTSSYAVAWRPDGLYMFVDVIDPSRYPAPKGDDIFCGDAVELYVDSDGLDPDAPGYAYPGTAQFIAIAPANATDSVANGQIWRNTGVSNSELVGPWSSSEFGAFPTPAGYTVEAFITAADLALASWTPSQQVGFDVAVDVSTPDGSPGSDCTTAGVRLGEYFLRGIAPTSECVTGGPFCNVLAFCTAALQE